jgi:drug/metabolite transporter (DMT)-like permease
MNTPLSPGTRTPAAPWLVAVALGIVYVVWGSTYLAIRVTVRDLPAMSSASWRYFAAAVVLAAILAIGSGWRRLQATARQLVGCAALGLLLPALGNGLVSVGESHGAPSGVAALLVAAVPLWIIVYRAGTGDRPPRRTVCGVLLGFAGLVALVTASGIDGDVHVGACLIIVVATVCWSLGSWSMPRLPLPEDPFVTTVYEMLFGSLFLLVGALIRGEHVLPQGAPAASWLAWGYLVVFGSVVAFTAYVWVLDAAPISLVATYAYVNPVVAVVLGWMILGEPLTLPILGGGGVAVAAVAVVVSSERRASSQRKSSAATVTPSAPDPPSEPCRRPDWKQSGQ